MKAGPTKTEERLFHSVEEIFDINAFTKRIDRRIQAWLEAKPRVCSDWSHIVTESWKETEGESIYIRSAKRFHCLCRELPVAIFDDELIVGTQTPYLRGGHFCMNWSTTAAEEIVRDRQGMGISERVQLNAGDDDLKVIEQDLDYWRGRTVEDLTTAAIQKEFPEWDYLNLALVGVCNPKLNGTMPIYARSADYGKVLEKGLRGIIQEAQERLKALRFTGTDDIDRWSFLNGIIIALEGMIEYANRYATLAREMAHSERDSKRKLELEKIADTCEWVPENPARNFYDAVQSVRFINLGLHLETAGVNELLDRIDQYLFPYYERDISEGRLTLQQAAEILACLWVKINDQEDIKPGYYRQYSPGEKGNHATIGGVDKDGNDATNELTYLILKVAQDVKAVRLSIYLRVHEETPDELLIKALEVNRFLGGGIPAFINDKRIIANLVEDNGVPIKDARNYAGEGCVRPFISTCGCQDFAMFSFNAPRAFELVMFNGWDPRLGKQVTPPFGDPRTFACIEDWVEAFWNQWDFWMPIYMGMNNFAFHYRGLVYSEPFTSALANDCISKGRDITRGGARYPQLYSGVIAQPRANLSDSLTAIKELVYDQRKLSIDDILDACSHNFEGGKKEQIRQMLVSASKYGNDDDQTDALAAMLSMKMSQEIRKFPNPYGYPARAYRPGAAGHFSQGTLVGALPDGRKAYTPLSDGGCSPMAGTDKKGPTAVLRSVYKTIDIHTDDGAVLNQKFPSSLLNTRENIMKIIALIRTYFEDYMGFMVQFNILDREQLLAAKKHPEEYRTLLVRVGGYSAYFVELPEQLQDEIIARTSQVF